MTLEWAELYSTTYQTTAENAVHLYQDLTLVRVYVATGRVDEAQKLLRQLKTAAIEAGRIGHLIESTLLEALAFAAKKEIDLALTSLKEAIQLSEGEEYLRLFIDETVTLAPLLLELHHKTDPGTFTTYQKALFRAFDTFLVEKIGVPPPKILVPTLSRRPSDNYFEHLSDREQTVLRLVAEGYTNREVAAKLVVTVGTIKTLINNMYRKLDVTNRVQLITRAQELHLL